MRRSYWMVGLLCFGFVALAAIILSMRSTILPAGKLPNVANRVSVRHYEGFLVHRPHEGGVSGLAFSPNSKELISAGGDDGTIKIWEVDTRRNIRTIPAVPRHTYLNGMAITPDGKLLASGTSEGPTRIWEAATGRELCTLRDVDKVRAVAFSPDGRILATGGSYPDSSVRLWDPRTGNQRGSLGELLPKRGVSAVAFSPNGRILAATSENNWVRLWDILEKRVSGSFRANANEQDGLYCVAFTPDGKHIATGGGEAVVRLWDVATCEQVTTWEGSHWPEHIAFSPSGNLLVADGGPKRDEVTVWETGTGQILTRARWEPRSVWRLALSPDGKWLAVGGSERIRLMEVEKLLAER